MTPPAASVAGMSGDVDDGRPAKTGDESTSPVVATRVSVVIPIRDEEASVGLLLNDLSAVTAALPQYEFDVIVVDDGSQDAGPTVAEAAGATVIRNGPPHGKGAALRRGFQVATGDIVVMMDGDYSHRAEDLGAFLTAMQPGVSMVIGSRIYGGSEEYTPVRALGNIGLTYLFGLLHGRYLSDALNGYKAFRREIATGHSYVSEGFDIEIELVCNALRSGGRIMEIPSHERARCGGRSKSQVIRHGAMFLWRELAEWWRSKTG